VPDDPALDSPSKTVVRNRQSVSKTAMGKTQTRLLPWWERRMIRACGSSRRALKSFWERHPDAVQALRAWYHDVKQAAWETPIVVGPAEQAAVWYHDVKHAAWETPADIRAVYATASFLGNNRVVFNIRGNQYRLVVGVQYRHAIVYVRFVGTHQEYDDIDAATI
jgi:mRNA interferase HigB